MPRYVILTHDWPAPHWDLLLEAGPELKAWRLGAEPGPGRTVPAEPNHDHRLFYLDYEGPLTGHRGVVKRWDTGTYEGELTSTGWTVRLEGERLTGLAHLRTVDEQWTFEVMRSL